MTLLIILFGIYTPITNDVAQSECSTGLMTSARSMASSSACARSFNSFNEGSGRVRQYGHRVRPQAQLGPPAGERIQGYPGPHRISPYAWKLPRLREYFRWSVVFWARTHRTHHKYSDTDADLSNASRGFFYSHIGWLMVHEHPEFVRKSKGIDMSDILNDPIARYQEKYYPVLAALGCFILPTLIPVYCWDESWTNAFFVPAIFRFLFGLHVTFLINSAAHLWGSKPYDKTILPSESWVWSIFTLGEGFHNYHHTFPWDYKTAELFSAFNFTTYFINCCAKIGWAYDLKTVSDEIIEKRAARTGDGSRPVWGWGDRDQTKEEMEAAIRINPKHD